MTIYLIVECDQWSSLDSYRIKQILTDHEEAKSLFERLAKLFQQDNPDGWILKLLSYQPISWLPRLILEQNVLREATEIASTDD